MADLLCVPPYEVSCGCRAHLALRGAAKPLRILRRRGRGGSGNDALDNLGLCLGVVLHARPLPARQLALRPSVELPVPFILAQALAQQQVAVDLGRARGEDVHVYVLRRGPEYPVLVESRLAHTQDVASSLYGGHVEPLVTGVFDHEQNVQYGLRGEPGHRGGADVLDRKRRRPKGRPDPRLFVAEALGPGGVVVRSASRRIASLRRAWSASLLLRTMTSPLMS